MSQPGSNLCVIATACHTAQVTNHDIEWAPTVLSLFGSPAAYALQVWDDAISDGCQADCRMATTLIEVCTRKGDTHRALATYRLMQEAALGSNMAPSVHAYTAAMRAAAEGGAWEQALDIWADMEHRNCKPTGMIRLVACCSALLNLNQVHYRVAQLPQLLLLQCSADNI